MPSRRWRCRYWKTGCGRDFKPAHSRRTRRFGPWLRLCGSRQPVPNPAAYFCWRWTPLRSVVAALWEQTTSAESRGVLLLAMDLTRRSWSGSERARRFFEEQQRLWAKMLREFLPDAGAVETLLQLFQGAM